VKLLEYVKGIENRSMRINSHPNSNRIIMIGAMALTSVAIMKIIDRNYYGIQIDPSWIIAVLIVAGIYVTALAVSEIYFSFFKSPQWVELQDKKLVIKMSFQKNYSIDVNAIEKVYKKPFYQISGSYGIKMFFPDRKLTLYFGKSNFDNLDAFFRELKKANPQCQIDELLL